MVYGKGLVLYDSKYAFAQKNKKAVKPRIQSGSEVSLFSRNRPVQSPIAENEAKKILRLIDNDFHLDFIIHSLVKSLPFSGLFDTHN